MPPTPISSVDAVRPAIERTKRMLFQPFRFGVWVRLAIIGVLTGEASSGGGFRGMFNIPHGTKAAPQKLLPSNIASLPNLPHFIALIVLLALLATVLVLVFMYLGSVLRFVLLDAVLTGRTHIREGFRRWQSVGTRFFVWQLFFQIILLFALLVFIGLPLLFAWRAGLFHAPLPTLFLGGFLLFLVLAALLAAGTIVWVLTKDFVVPIMALDGVNAVEGWRRLKPMLAERKGSYAGYLGMKLVLAIAAGLLFGIMALVVMLILLIPVGLVGVIIYLIATSAGLTWNVFTIAAAVVAGVVAVAALVFLIALVCVPMVVFFQAYVLQFFGTRYDRLAAIMYPEPPPAAPPAAPEPPPTPPEPSPLPA